MGHIHKSVHEPPDVLYSRAHIQRKNYVRGCDRATMAD